MLTLLFIILMFAVFGKMIAFSVRAAWGLTKIILYIVFLPVILLGMFFSGFVAIALPVLLVIGVVMLLMSVTE